MLGAQCMLFGELLVCYSIYRHKKTRQVCQGFHHFLKSIVLDDFNVHRI